MGGFEFTVLQRNIKEWHERPVDVCLWVLKQSSTASMSGTVFWSYPILPFGIFACSFFPTTFLEIAVCKMRPGLYIDEFSGELAQLKSRGHGSQAMRMIDRSTVLNQICNLGYCISSFLIGSLDLIFQPAFFRLKPSWNENVEIPLAGKFRSPPCDCLPLRAQISTEDNYKLRQFTRQLTRKS